MLELYERIRIRREELGLSQEELAKKMGYKSRSSINKIETGENDIPQSKVKQFAIALDTTIAYLMGWSDESEPRSTIFDIPNIVPIPKTKKVPLLGSIACGEPILAEQNIESYVDIEAALNADFALRCKGDSMIGARIFNGDIVFIRQQPDVDDGAIAAVLIDNEATLKRVYKIGSRLQLRAENIAYPPMEFEGEKLSDIRILGKAVGFFSANI